MEGVGGRLRVTEIEKKRERWEREIRR
jgi:hypothetical protein